MQQKLTEFEKQQIEEAVVEPIRVLPRFMNVYSDETDTLDDDGAEAPFVVRERPPCGGGYNY
jgi:hypothetical protein